MKPAATTTHRTDWHWGPVHFDGLFGLHGTFLCFHRHPAADSPDVTVDPAKPILPLQPADPAALPDFIVRE